MSGDTGSTTRLTGSPKPSPPPPNPFDEDDDDEEEVPDGPPASTNPFDEDDEEEAYVFVLLVYFNLMYYNGTHLP